MSTTLYFHGGAGMVTGANFLIESGTMKLLIDCGFFQGTREAEERNWEPFRYEPSSISHLLVTHAHIDHIGRIPRLVRCGFNGTILSTEATKALAEPLLLDSTALATRNAEYRGREPLYNEKDVARTMERWETTSYRKPFTLPDDFVAEFYDAGHILGAAMVRLERGIKSIVFTGDLGGGNSPLIARTDTLPKTDYLVVESVYGDRVRKEDANRRDLLENFIEDAVARGGSLLIPAFSTERTQDLLFEIRALMLERRVPEIPVYVDAPLAKEVTAAYLACPQYFAPEIRARVAAGENIFSFPQLRFTAGEEESRAIARQEGSKIILAGSGMMGGGRILVHEKWLLPDHHSTLLLVGYQAAGTVGRRLLEGEKKVRLFGTEVPVRCRVEAIYGYSAHMDGEALLEFVNQLGRDIEQVFVVMGEPAAASFLTQRIRDYLGVRASAPEIGDKVELNL